MQCQPTACDRPHGHLGGGRRRRHVTGSKGGGMTDQSDSSSDPVQAVPKALGRVDDERLQRHHRLRPALDGAVSGYLQMADHLRRSGLRLGRRGRLTVQDGSRSALGIETVGFAMKMAPLAVGARDVDDGMPSGSQGPRQAGAERSRALDAEGPDRAESPRPRCQFGVAVRRRRDAQSSETSSLVVDRNRDMGGFVRIDADNYLFHGVLTDGLPGRRSKRTGL